MVTPVRKGRQAKLGYLFGNAVNPIEFYAQLNHQTVTPTSATIEVFASDGTTSLLASTAMTAANPSTYTLDLSGALFVAGTNYQIEHTFVSTAVTYTVPRRLFGIYNQMPGPLVTEEDLSELLYDAADYTGDRTDWSWLIGEAWNQILIDLSLERRPDGTELDPYDIADSTQLYKPHLYCSLMLMARELRNTDDDRFGLLVRDYKEDYEKAMEKLIQSQLELWSSGPAISEEVYEKNKIRSHIRAHSPSDQDQFTNKSVAPKFRMDTKW